MIWLLSMRHSRDCLQRATKIRLGRSFMDPFKAFRIHSEDGRNIEARLETIELDDLSAGDVVIRGAYSSINYKGYC